MPSSKASIKNILSEITITIEGVKIKRVCTVRIDTSADDIEAILVHPAWAKSKLDYEDISEHMFEMLSFRDYEKLTGIFKRLIERGVEEDTDPRANVECPE